MVHLVLVRHGESTWNASGRWQGWADPPLSPLGRAQAAAAVGAVGAVDEVVASDLRRALETAEIMAPALGCGPVAVEAGLRERDVGALTGLTRDEIDRRWPGLLSGSVGLSQSSVLGETVDQLNQRVEGALRRLAVGRDDGRVLVVTHGGVVRNLERRLGIEPAPLPNLAGREMLVGPDGTVVDPGRRVLLLDPDDVPVTTPRQP